MKPAIYGSARARCRAHLLRGVYFIIALCFWIMSRFGRSRKNRTVVLCYHGVPDSQREAFVKQMKQLQGRAVARADSQIPSKGRRGPCVLVTFDDAFVNLITNAIPTLEEYAIPATVFAVVDNLGQRPRWAMPAGHPERSERVMTGEELKAIAALSNITVGSHTLTHPRLDTMSSDQLEHELTESKAQLEALLGVSISDLALPHGAWTPAVIQEARAAGYRRIFTLDHDLQSWGDAVVVGRFSVSPAMSKIEYLLLIDGAYSWLGALRRCVSSMKTHGLNPIISHVLHNSGSTAS